MELRHLRYFATVAETLHFSRAAERLHMTQPALSRQIRDLEGEIGAALLQRHGARTALTPAGERFAVRAREILAAADRAVAEARATARQIRFGHYGALWAEHYTPALRAFAKKFSDVVLQPVELSPAELVVALRRGEVDIALLGPITPALRKEFDTRSLSEVPAIVAMGAANPLAKRRSCRLEELRDASWLMWDDASFPGRGELLRAAAAKAGFTPRVVQSVDSVASVFMQVAMSDAIGYVLPMSRQMPHSGVVFVALRPPAIVFEMNVAWRRDSSHAARLVVLAETLAQSSR